MIKILTIYQYICLLLIIILISSCDGIKKDDNRKEVEVEYIKDSRFEILTIDDCEYIILYDKVSYAGMGGITHKENCKFCNKRTN